MKQSDPINAKFLISICVLWVTASVGVGSAQEVGIHFAVQPDSVQWDTGHSSLAFMCRVVITNQTPTSLTVSNLFQDKAGLCMKITDTSGKELARLIAPPFHYPTITIPVGTNEVFWPYYGILGRFDPGPNRTVRLQLTGKLLGSNYTNPIVSEFVEMKIP